MPKSTQMETIREFFMRRSWLRGTETLLSESEYEALKARALLLPKARQMYLLAFIDGWKSTKP